MAMAMYLEPLLYLEMDKIIFLHSLDPVSGTLLPQVTSKIYSRTYGSIR